MKFGLYFFGFACLLLVVVGCQDQEDANKSIEKAPIPVDVDTLILRPAPSSALVAASVASWKTEEIGFEVGGRIDWVAEPNTDVEGRVVDGEGNVLFKGTEVARVESERFQLQLDSAIADVSRAEKRVEAAKIELTKSMQSQRDAAEAELTLAEIEFKRSEELLNKNAGSESDVDRDRANFKTAAAKIEQIDANIEAKAAEIISLELEVKKANQARLDAKRSLDDCKLYSSFPGQIVDVSVVLGSVVSAGSPVATVQMMDPIKIEIEVSAEESRRLRKRQLIPVHVTQTDGTVEVNDGFLYLIDSVADTQTRTFTLTLLMLNKRIGRECPDPSESLAITDQGWRLDFKFLPGAKEGLVYVNQQSVFHDDEGAFMWRLENYEIGDQLPEGRIFDVSKTRVEVGPSTIQFLGNWIFQQVTILDPTFDTTRHMVAGKLTVQKDVDPNHWNGKQVVIDRDPQWMVRPGDLVKIDLSNGNSTPGFFVPMDAIVYENSKKYLLLLESADGTTEENWIVRRREILVDEDDATSSIRRIQPLSGTSLEGRKYVRKGAHYLVDGESVRINQGVR